MARRGAIGLGLALIAMAAESGPPYGHPTPGFPYPQYWNYTLWLVEEFDAPLDLNADDVWTWSDGGLAEGQMRFIKEAIKFEDGKMIIEASQEPPPIAPDTCSHAEVGPIPQKPLTSGEMRTKHNMFRYGRYEVRMKAPTVQPGDPFVNGNYVATMFAFRDGKFHHWREVDIEVTGDAVNSVGSNVINAEYPVGFPQEHTDAVAHRLGGVNFRTAFHTFAFEWLPSGITWFFDNEPIRHYAADEKIPLPDMSTKIMMSLWVYNGPPYPFGGKDGGSNRYPMRVEYDWFRFYRWNFDTQYPCEGNGVSCLSEEDWYLSSNNPCDGIEQVGDAYRTPCKGTCPYGNQTREIII